MAESAAAELPQFYSELQALNRQQHKALRKRARTNFSFAADSNAVPVSLAEFVPASRDYPLVFAGSGEGVHTVAVLGVLNNENLLVSADGYWEADRYIPAYIRRYPFILAKAEKAGELTVCIDRSNQEFDADEGQPLFNEDGSDSEFLGNMLTFLNRYQTDLETMRQFAAALDAAGLLEEVSADITLKLGAKYRLQGLRIVSRKRLLALDEKQCKQWLDNGYLEHIHLHLASLSNFASTIDRLGGRHPEPPTPPE